jgi:hypothetical protein
LAVSHAPTTFAWHACDDWLVALKVPPGQKQDT